MNIMDEKNHSEEDLLENLAEKVKVLLARFGTLSLKNGDYWLGGVDVTTPSVDVLVFQKVNFTPDLLADCASLLDDYPANFRIRFIEVGKDGKPLEPLGGLNLNRFGAERI